MVLFLSKIIEILMVNVVIRVILGENLIDFGYMLGFVLEK